MKGKSTPVRPSYSQPSTGGVYSPAIAEQIVDDAREGYKREMQFWWDSLTLKQKKEEWKKDGDQLQFYVSKPK